MCPDNWKKNICCHIPAVDAALSVPRSPSHVIPIHVGADLVSALGRLFLLLVQVPKNTSKKDA